MPMAFSKVVEGFSEDAEGLSNVYTYTVPPIVSGALFKLSKALFMHSGAGFGMQSWHSSRNDF